MGKLVVFNLLVMAEEILKGCGEVLTIAYIGKLLSYESKEKWVILFVGITKISIFIHSFIYSSIH